MSVVLVVDDDAAVRRLVVNVLGKRGYTVLEAENGADAVSRASQQQEPVSLLLTDVVMPGMTGEQLAETLRERDPSLRVLFMSGYSEDDFDDLGIRAIGGGYLTKPFSPDVLTMAVQGVFAR